MRKRNINKKERPIIKIEKETLDWFIEMTGISALIVLIVLPMLYYSELPDIVPTHFGLDGTPDDYGSKSFIWFLPGLGVALYVGLSLLNRVPHVFNYPVEITPVNAKKQYYLATKLVRVLNTAIACIFSYLNYVIIQSSSGTMSGESMVITPAIMMAIFAIIGVYIYKSRQ